MQQKEKFHQSQIKNDILKYKTVKDNLTVLYKILLVIFIILSVLYLFNMLNFLSSLLLFLANVPIAYLYSPRHCNSCGKKLKRIVLDESVYYVCHDCKQKIQLKIGLLRND